MQYKMIPHKTDCRLFFALWPDETLQQRLAQTASRLSSIYDGKPVPAYNIHLTLVFIGQFDQAKIPVLIDAIGAFKPETFALRLNRVGAFRNTNVVWVAPAVMPPQLTLLVNNLRNALWQADFGFDNRPFVPHVTLLRKARWCEPADLQEPIDWEVQGFELVQSVSETDGVRYEVLKRFAEAAAAKKT
jgi:RNA 2',3'-cyclic 3'-phosphodiesterase